jgi:tagatose-1,6-bisphosphate aldolase
MTSTELAVLADGQGHFAVLAMDQRGTLSRMLDAVGRPERTRATPFGFVVPTGARCTEYR